MTFVHKRSRPLTTALLLWCGLLLTVTDANNNNNNNVGLPSYYHVPEFNLHDLRTATTTHDDERLRRVLGTTGLLAVRVPDDAADLRGLCDCELGPHIPNGDRSVLAGGVVRSTIATATLGTELPGALPREAIERSCGAGGGGSMYDALEDARDVVSRAVTTGLLPALERLTGRSGGHDNNNGNDDVPMLRAQGRHDGYRTITAVVEDEEAVHLEHFHVYSRDNDNETQPPRRDGVPRATLDWHTDAGLFLAFLPGQRCGGSSSDDVDDSFRVRVPSNDAADPVTESVAVFPQPAAGEVVVAMMLGTGAEHWLHMPTPTPGGERLRLRATQHAVQMSSGDRRVWYGMMYLVPPKAIVQTSPHGKELTFADMRKSVAVHSASRRFGDEPTASSHVSVGCGNQAVDDDDHNDQRELHGKNREGFHHPHHGRNNGRNYKSSSRRSRVQHGVDPLDCSNNEDGTDFYCWMQCPTATNANNESTRRHLADGESVYCAKRSILAETRDVGQAVAACTDEKGVVGGVMDAGCENVWHTTEEGVFSYLASDVKKESNPADTNNNNNNDNNLYGNKYCYGTTSMYMQGFEWEGTTCLVYLFKSWVITSRFAFVLACLGTIFFGVAVELVLKYRKLIVGNMSNKNPKKKMASSALTYGVQLTLGYMLMLVVMTYSGPLVMCCVLGLMVGHVVCHWEALKSSSGEHSGLPGSSRRLSSRRVSTSGGNNNNVDLFSGGGTTPCCLAPPSETTSIKDSDTESAAELLSTEYGTTESSMSSSKIVDDDSVDDGIVVNECNC